MILSLCVAAFGVFLGHSVASCFQMQEQLCTPRVARSAVSTLTINCSTVFTVSFFPDSLILPLLCFKGFVITCMCLSLPHPPPRPGAIGHAAIRFGPHGHAQAARLPGLSRSHSKDTAFACSQSCVLMLCVRFDAIFLKKTSATHFRRMRMPMALCGLPSGCVRDESPSALHGARGRAFDAQAS